MKYKILVAFIGLIALSSTPFCLNTYQFKIFPVGVYNNTIISIDAKIHRTSVLEGNSRYDLDFKGEEWDSMWIIEMFETTYDKKQNVLSKISIDTVYSLESNYTNTFKASYLKACNNIINTHKSIDLFKPQYLSFCDYRSSCNIITRKIDSVNDKSFLTYNNKNYPITIINNESYYGFNNSTLPNFNSNKISSTRIYKTKNLELVLGHFGTGHQLSMGWITEDPNKKPKDEYDTVIYANEHIPDMVFNNIKTAVYKEPLLHHGYGYDIFIVKD